MRSVEQSLLRMGLSEIDILLIHDCDVWTHGADAGRRFKEAMDGAYRALDKLRSEKTVAAMVSASTRLTHASSSRALATSTWP